ncbi:MAG: hypothetical protein FJ137_04940 [Deltaproteobacteria bacterium]|nr:hypothetical protein [Deltaproteobacteria bacterium]
MIVTCPGCASKYRVKNESVPDEGARMRCPKCETQFLARPPSDQRGSEGASSSSIPPGLTAAPYAGTPPVPGPPPGTSPFAVAPSSGSFPPSGPLAGPLASQGPAAGKTQGPLTAMIQAVDESSLRAAVIGPSPVGPRGVGAAPSTTPPTQSPPATRPRPLRADDDPFAHIAREDPEEAPATPAPQRRAEPGVGAPPRERPRTVVTATAAPASIVQGEVTSTRALRRARPSAVATIGSWAALALAGACALGGAMFAAWTSEAVDLDPTLLPTLEARFGVSPPRSFVGRDDRPFDELAAAAEASGAAGDLPGAAVLWKQALARRPEDPRATTALQRTIGGLDDTAR